MWLDADTALRHVDRLNAAALALCGNRPDAEDLVQETFMTLLRNRHIDMHRSASRRQVVALHESEEPVDRRTGLRPDEVAEQQEVFAAVHAMESPFRETVVAVDVLGLSYKEAAKALDVPVGT